MISKGLKKLQGVIVPVITPLTKDEKLNRSSLEKQLNALISAEVDSIFLGGSAGLGPMLDDNVWQELMSNALEIVGDKCQLLSGIIETSTSKAIKKINFLEGIGYDTIVVTPTFYITLQHTWEFMNHFQACREATNMRMLAYNIPSCTGSEIPLECIRELCQKDWIEGVKESSADNDYFQKALEITKEYGIKIFQGSESNISWALQKGAAGIVPVCANFDPELFVKTWRSRKNSIQLEECQKQIDTYYVEIVVGDSTRSWVNGIISETVARHQLDCTILSPL